MLAATQYGNWLPPMYSAHGGQIDHLIDVIHYFMGVLFVGWGAFFVYCLVNFRKRAGHTAQYHPIKAKASKVVEAAVLLFEVILLLAMSRPVWAAYKNSPPTEKENPLLVHVSAKQFEWQFHYAGKDGKFGKTRLDLIGTSNPIGLVEDDADAKDDIVLINEFHIPAGRPVRVEITSRDVIHSFDIPTLRVKQDAVPGMRIPIWFTVNDGVTNEKLIEQMTESVPIESAKWYKLRWHVSAEDYKGKDGGVLLAKGADLGTTLTAGNEMLDNLKKAGVKELKMHPRTPLEVVCAQLCGNNHYTMKAQVIVHDAAGFDKWLNDETAKKAKGVDVDF